MFQDEGAGVNGITEVQNFRSRGGPGVCVWGGGSYSGGFQLA